MISPIGTLKNRLLELEREAKHNRELAEIAIYRANELETDCARYREAIAALGAIETQAPMFCEDLK